MSWFSRLRKLLRSDRVSDEIDRELEFHLRERATLPRWLGHFTRK